MTRGHLFESGGHLFEMEGHLFDKERHLFDGKGHLFWKGSQFCYKLLGERNFDYVYEPLGPVHMVKKGHKYVTLLQINVPRVMILSQNLGNLFDKGTFI